MNGIASFLLFILVIIIGWLLYMHVNKKTEGLKIAKWIIAIVLALPFLFLSFVMLFVMMWGSGRKNKPYPYDEHFVVYNHSSIPLRVNACFSYTRKELETLRQNGVKLDPTMNFLFYQNVLIADSANSLNSYTFQLSRPSYVDSLSWPNEAYMTLCDTSGFELFYLDSYSLDSLIQRNWEWIITDSLLKSATNNSKRKGGVK